MSHHDLTSQIRALCAPPPAVTSNVKYGTTSGSYSATATGNENNKVFTYTYDGDNGNTTYQSPIQHHVLLSNLAGNTTYYYIVGELGLSSHGNCGAQWPNRFTDFPT